VGGSAPLHTPREKVGALLVTSGPGERPAFYARPPRATQAPGQGNALALAGAGQTQPPQRQRACSAPLLFLPLYPLKRGKDKKSPHKRAFLQLLFEGILAQVLPLHSHRLL